ncbi:hypothetical protein E8E14_010356 [Neopestalotiopsis sp. 37M]|nr:hypothetical protein E8E14_010356 [Neopestalotiopsis sp. 37M]
MAFPRPHEPTEQEREGYYFGLSGSPKLIARTSVDHWSPPMSEGMWTNMYRKTYSAVSEHEIVAKWSKDIAPALVVSLEQCPWSCLFPIRIGLHDPAARRREVLERRDFPVILLLMVEPDSLTWEHAVSMALRYRGILESHGVFDVEVEVMEGYYDNCAASKELDAGVQHDQWRTRRTANTNEEVLPMLSYPGVPVTYLDSPTSQGTVGLHLQLEGKSPAIYGLTCRHVVCSTREDYESYDPSERTKQNHVQGSKRTFEDLLHNFEMHEKILRKEMDALQGKKERWEQWYVGNEVYLRLHGGYKLPGNPPRKWSSQRAGPFTVMRRIGDMAYI